MPRDSIHFAKSCGICAMPAGLILGLAFPCDTNAETVDRRNGANAPILSKAIHIKLARDRQIVGDPEVQVAGGSEPAQKILADAGLRAIRCAAPFTMLPKCDVWKEVVFNFDTSALTQ